MSMTTLADSVRTAGVIGAGGAGFPTHAKLEKPVGTIIVNGAQCEPMMFGDQEIMEKRANDMLAGLQMVINDFANRQAGLNPKAVVCIKKKYGEAISSVRAGIGRDAPVEILELENIYPGGDEQILVHTATGRTVPEGGIPPMVGALVMNVETLTQVADAGRGKPVTERLVTLGGEVEKPCVARIPIGTPFSQIIPRLRPQISDYAILVNGPMMGRITFDENEVTTKTMGGIFILPKDHSHVRRMTRPLTTEIRLSRAVCEACRYCTDFCPRYLLGHALEPHKIMRVINYDCDLDTPTITSASLCCECGVCDLWACPMFLSPRVIFREFKKRLKKAGVSNPHNRSELSADPQRRFRGVPADRLIRRLGLSEYDTRPPFDPAPWPVSRVRIRLTRHIGVPAKPSVRVGAEVARGDLIAKPDPKTLGAAYHASIPGRVTDVNDEWISIEGANT